MSAVLVCRSLAAALALRPVLPAAAAPVGSGLSSEPKVCELDPCVGSAASTGVLMGCWKEFLPHLQG